MTKEEREKYFYVGALVYRPSYDRVEQGVIRKANVEKSTYTAQFGGHNEFSGEWVDYIYKNFFWDPLEARAALVQTLKDRVLRKEREIVELEELIQMLELDPIEQLAIVKS